MGDKNLCIAPLWDEIFKWFRVKHGYELFINPNVVHNPYGGGRVVYYDIELLHGFETPPLVSGKTYEKARLACLEKLIELIS